MTSKELKEIIKLARKNGITHLKIDGVELAFTEQAVVVKPKKSESDNSSDETKPQYSEEDMLFWSSTSPGAFNETN